MVSVLLSTEYTLTLNYAGIPEDFTIELSLQLAEDKYSTSLRFKIDSHSLLHGLVTTIKNSWELMIPGMPTQGYTFDFTGTPDDFRTTLIVATFSEAYPTFGVDYTHQ